ncbi:S-adenosyl-L-methionine-dependent methyltransferase [Karstenula rhodostoma CBS 690.94]|uniref:S-adenosyl-L-methionine-dependent methyltransferase n=1 Tax=Karstenula rhodostoma CBS 690.94 TaxID=1392251 RepID=A0A9P4PPF1_9PLEO|nr:S-adenosyl-L-methionine-dependent methyltransferase [Karstenula rhodostoma CBS 690.94]
MLADTYLISLSDTQAVTSIALLATANFFVGCTISAYHYDLVCSLVLMSSVAYIGSLVVMHKYFDVEKHRLLQYGRSAVRVLMIATSFILSFILFHHRSNIFPSNKPHSYAINHNRTSSTSLILSAACFIDHPGQSNASNPQNFTALPNWTRNYTIQASANQSSLLSNSSSYGISNISSFANMPAFSTFNSNDDLSSGSDLIALSFLLGACIVAALTSLILSLKKAEGACQHDHLCRHRLAYLSRGGCFVTTHAVTLYGLGKFWELKSWMMNSVWFAKDDTGESKVGSFGQLMPWILLSLPALAFIEALAVLLFFYGRNTANNPSQNVYKKPLSINRNVIKSTTTVTMSTNFSPYVSALQTFYNNVGKSYNTMTKSVHAGGPDRIVDAAGAAIKPGSSVLDLATGTGKVAFAAAAKVGEEGRVLGIDISDEFVGLAAKAAAEAGIGDRVEFLQRDVGDLALPGKYGRRWADAVTCGSAIAMFSEPRALLDTLARDVLRPGGVFVADMWATHLPAKLFLDVAIPRGFEAPFDALWLADTEAAFRRLFEGTRFRLVRVEKAGESMARWDVESGEKVEALWRSLAREQTWLSFGLDGLDEGSVEEIKRAWVEEIEARKNEEGAVVKEMSQWIAVAVMKE